MQTTIINHAARLLQIPVESIELSSSFVNLGGHSLVALGLASACSKDGIKLTVESILLSPSMSDLIASAVVASPLQTHTQLETQTETQAQPPSQPQMVEKKVEKITACADTTLTEMQLSFLHSHQKSPGSNMINFLETYQTAHLPIVKAAWQTVIQTEDIFHMSFDADDCHKQPTAPFKWTETVVSSREEYEAALCKDVDPAAIECAFDVVTLPAAGVSTIIWRVHHAFVDGMSGQLVYGKVRDAIAGRTITPGTPFRSVANDLRRLQQENQQKHQQFWVQLKKQHPQPAGELVLAPVREEMPAGIDSITFAIPLAEISAHARQTGVSLAAWYHAAWAMVLSLYADSDSVVFGTVLSGRNLPIAGVQDTIGPLLNVLPFHVALDRQMSTRDFLRTIFAHSVQLASMQSSLPDDGYSRHFTSAIAMEFEMKATDDCPVRPVEKSWFRVVPDTPLSVYTTYDGTLRLCFRPQQYNREDIQLLADHFQNAILSLVSDQTMGQSMAGLMTDGCRDTLMRFGNCNNDLTSLCSVHDDLVTLFERAVCKSPEGIAVEKGGVQMTYAEMDRRATVLAERMDIQPGEVVCVLADRSVNWIIAIYGVLKAGGVYSAQDPGLPDHIRSINFQTGGGTLYLVPNNSQRHRKPETCNRCLSVEELTQDIPPDPVPRHRFAPRPEDNAYLCFTSGSTGKPKGVMCHHAGLVAFQMDLEVRLFAAPGQRISQLMSPAFDGSIHEIFSALCYGATLVLADGVDPFAHLKKSNAAILTPSVAKILAPKDFAELRTVYLVGEPVPQYVNDVWSSATTLYNMYGPTEATCGATITRLLPSQTVTIGGPNPTTRIYILGQNQQLLPPGVVGEIYCAGVQVANGYIGRPELTAERFLPDTITNRPGEKMYRTGDRGFFTRSGQVECLGRNDRQIKLRGYRTDINDLETRVAQAIHESTAVAICPRDDYLVAMIQPQTLDVTDVRSRMSQVLPMHAMPRRIMAVDKFPMTPAGKLDYQEIANQCTAIAPQPAVSNKPQLSSKTEIALADLWKELLSLGSDSDLVTPESSFVSLGGHSVVQLRLASKIFKTFGVKMPVTRIVESTNLSELARTLDGLIKNVPTTQTQAVKPLGRNKVSPIEREWLEKYNIELGTSAFNVTFACKIDSSKVDVDQLIACWNAVLARHDIFRSRSHLDYREKGPRRVYARYSPQVMRAHAFNLWREANRPFQLDRQHPIRVIVSKTMMLATMSHLIADLTSLQVILAEVIRLYRGQGLGPIKRRYHETTQWSTTATTAETAWWAQYLDGAVTHRDYSIPNVTHRSSYGGRTHIAKLSKTLATRTIQFSKVTSTTLHQLALAAVALALQHTRNDTDIVLGGPYFNRGPDDLETVGLFLEPIPIRIRFPGTTRDRSVASTHSFVRAVQRSSQSAIAHAIPWTQLLQAVGVRPEFPNHPLLDVMVTFHDDRASPKMPVDGLDPVITYAKGAKFALLVEFCAVSDGTILMRLEHDTECIPTEKIHGVERLILEALRMVVEGVGYASIKEKLRRMAALPGRNAKVTRYFGKGIAEIRNE
ncbi:acetyl-CoA synthetase-like protein [Aspergillus taichungensis]|uniref:Acetyl-CoA synthetase-like protein n=1 Tax=Aspergillus taichungensis TaxID=482145 RepID=A0A2J5HHS9_9EURO|nr:acetyl-CoA synthetase-like protein [Aspergillus taichungensis]